MALITGPHPGPKGDTGPAELATVVDAKGDLIAATAADTVTRLPVGTAGQVLGVDASAGTGLAWRSSGATNLLTTQDASLESSGVGTWLGYLCTLTRSTTRAYSGSASLLITADGAGGTSAYHAAGSRIPVTPGRVYTASAKVYAGVGSRTVRATISWYTSADALISQSPGAYIVPTAAWSDRQVSAVAPATAAWASADIEMAAGSASDTVFVDAIGLWEGAGGTYASPGAPIEGLGTWVDESVGRRIFTWDPINSRWQLTYGDTGTRDVSAGLINSWAGSLYVRRVGWTVNVYGLLTKDSASADAAYLIPTGFRPKWGGNTFTWSAWNAAVGSQVAAWVDGSQNIAINRAAASTGSGVTRLGTSWETADAWPASLPGSASGSIPAS